MEIIRTIAGLRARIGELKAVWRNNGRDGSVGFVPTMGYLHEGHVSLMKKARDENDIVVLSIFVNPLQFGPSEDFDKYPRDEHRDLQVAEQAGVDLAFLPEVGEMYPEPTRTKIIVSDITGRLCGASRPGHFDGVATVVTKLFHIVQPNRAYFGLKDAQQVAVIERMVFDLNLPVEIVPCPIVRVADGLALSSRNVYLSPEEREQALILSQTLRKAKEWIREPGITYDQLRERIAGSIRTAPLAEIDYAEVVIFPALEPAEQLFAGGSDRILIALAVKFGKTRLIDNVIVQAGEE